MRFKIKSKVFGREITFSRPGSWYIYVDLNDQSGSLGFQICHGGYLMGDTVEYIGDDYDEFEKVCRRWYRSAVRNLKRGLI